MKLHDERCRDSSMEVDILKDVLELMNEYDEDDGGVLRQIKDRIEG